MAETTGGVGAGTRSGVITLLTDFGLDDGYVAAVKGVIASLAPDARVIDVCHRIPAHDVRRGGIVWASAVPYFPPGTVHVAVVDPGVGTARRILAVEARGSIFLAPDNGIIGHVASRREIRSSVEVRAKKYFLPRVSATFHGRDVFAPVAARLASGLAVEALGPPRRPTSWDALPSPRRRTVARGGRRVVEDRGEIVLTDGFGNAVTNLRPPEGRRLESLVAGGLTLRGLHRAYGEAPEGAPLVLVGSTGHVEIAVNRGRASEALQLRVGDRVTATWA